MNTKLVTGTLLDADGTCHDRESFVVREHSLSVLVDGTLAFQCVCTRTGLRELVIGRLFTEGIILSADNIEEIRFNEYENEASVFLKGEANLFIGSRRKQLSKLLPVTEVRREWIFALAKEFSKETKLHHATQGTHSCFLGRKGAVLFSCEDIGRHNAVDKAVGYALVNEIPLGECMLFCSHGYGGKSGGLRHSCIDVQGGADSGIDSVSGCLWIDADLPRLAGSM